MGNQPVKQLKIVSFNCRGGQARAFSSDSLNPSASLSEATQHDEQGSANLLYHNLILDQKPEVISLQDFKSQNRRRYLSYMNRYEPSSRDSGPSLRRCDLLAIDNHLNIEELENSERGILDRQISYRGSYQGYKFQVITGQKPNREINEDDLIKITDLSHQYNQLILGRFSSALVERLTAEGWSLSKLGNSIHLLYRGEEIESVDVRISKDIINGSDQPVLLIINLKPINKGCNLL